MGDDGCEQSFAHAPSNSDERQLLSTLIRAHYNVPPGEEHPFRIVQNDRIRALRHGGFWGRDFGPDWLHVRRLVDDGYLTLDGDSRGVTPTVAITVKGLAAYKAISQQGGQPARQVNPKAVTASREKATSRLTVEAEPNESHQRQPTVFCAYSHTDETFLDELVEHFALLRRQGKIREWHDRKIVAGQEWENFIDKNLESSDIILLLVSSSFINSDYCYGREMSRAMERHESGETRVIPIIVRHVDWKDAPFGKLQALPKDGKPVHGWFDRDEAWTDVVKGIRRVVSNLSSAPPSPPKAPHPRPQDEETRIPVEEDDDGEPGLLDLAEEIEHAWSEITRLSKELVGVPQDFVRRNEEISKMPLSFTNSANASLFAPQRKVFDALSHSLNHLSSEIDERARLLTSEWQRLTIATESYYKMMDFDNVEHRRNAEVMLVDLSKIDGEARQFAINMNLSKEAMQQLKGMSKGLNRAVSRCEHALNRVITAWEAGGTHAAKTTEVVRDRLS